MKISARNILKGTVKSITDGAINSEIVIDVNGTEIASQISRASVDHLGLKVGKSAYAVIKIDNVLIGVD
ncbi:MAG: molybdopterin-binding protein [Chthoniobacteraceae bacterium]